MGNEYMLSGIYGEDFFLFRDIGMPPRDRLGLGILNKTTEQHRQPGPESFPFLAISVVLRGSGSYEDCATGRKFPLRAGNFFLRIPGIEHIMRIDLQSGWLEYFLDLGLYAWPYFHHYLGVSPENPVGMASVDVIWQQKFMKLATELERSPEHRLLEQLPAFFSLTSDCIRQLSRHDRIGRMVEEACFYLSSDYRASCDIQSFCREHGWGYESFRKHFQALMGISPGKYRTRRRMDAARALLMQKTLPIAEIARRLGYCSGFEFAAKFKQHTGLSPSAFRQNNNTFPFHSSNRRENTVPEPGAD